MSEYSPRPGTVRSKLGRDEIDEPCTRTRTGNAGAPAFGWPRRFRYMESETARFLAQYSQLQISPVEADRGGAGASLAPPCASEPMPNHMPPATTTARREEPPTSLSLPSGS